MAFKTRKGAAFAAAPFLAVFRNHPIARSDRARMLETRTDRPAAGAIASWRKTLLMGQTYPAAGLMQGQHVGAELLVMDGLFGHAESSQVLELFFNKRRRSANIVICTRQDCLFF
jgi:hypothetical protein